MMELALPSQTRSKVVRYQGKTSIEALEAEGFALLVMAVVRRKCNKSSTA